MEELNGILMKQSIMYTRKSIRPTVLNSVRPPLHQRLFPWCRYSNYVARVIHEDTRRAPVRVSLDNTSVYVVRNVHRGQYSRRNPEGVGIVALQGDESVF